MIKKNHYVPGAKEDSGMDPNVHLNAISGRTGGRISPLLLGPHFRIRSGSVLYAGSQIGNHFETGHNVVIREGNRIGNRVNIWNNSTIDYNCVIGNDVKIHCNVYVAQYTVLEDGVFLAPGVTIANDLFPGSAGAMNVLAGPRIRKGAQIGVNVTILPGVEIGARALIGSGSVVTHSIPSGAVAWGNPARVHKQISDLAWPMHFPLLRKEASAFFKTKLAGRKAF